LYLEWYPLARRATTKAQRHEDFFSDLPDLPFIFGNVASRDVSSRILADDYDFAWLLCVLCVIIMGILFFLRAEGGLIGKLLQIFPYIQCAWVKIVDVCPIGIDLS